MSESIRDQKDIISNYRSFSIKNSLTDKYPELAAEWHPSLNGSLSPSNIPGSASRSSYYWQCRKCGYSWKASLDTRIRGTGCPVGVGKVVMAGYNDLLSQEPIIANEWHPTRNGDLLPNQVTRQSRKRVWWECQFGHEWVASICDRTRGTGCPYCAGKKVLKGFNDLKTKNPSLALEWDRSNDKSANEVTEHSGYRALWRCSKCGFTWEAPVYSRSAGFGCPYCAKKKDQRST